MLLSFPRIVSPCYGPFAIGRLLNGSFSVKLGDCRGGKPEHDARVERGENESVTDSAVVPG